MRIGVDIGGTFTDFIFLDQESGSVRMWKTLTTSPDPSEGVLQGLKVVLGDVPKVLEEVQQIVHGTTIGANTIIERTGAKTLLIITRGFRDVLEIQRQRRPNLYDMFQDKPIPLVPHHHVAEVTERVAYNGETLVSLNKKEVIDLAGLVARDDFEAVAISFLHAYANPSHERRVQAILQEHLSDIPISLSSEVSPKYREYERTNTTVANSYILPKVRNYLKHLRMDLETSGYTNPLFVMQSNGGITTAAIAERYPVQIIESGPAAGAIAAAYLAKLADLKDVISFDMGGTTAKVSLIERGVPTTTDEFEIDRRDLVPESGLPLSIPSIELIEIGAGGGSIASVNMGTIVVGPKSTGADPGPACYGKQIEHPTVTDADLILGYLNADYFLGGEMKLTEDAARTVLIEKIGTPLGLSTEEAAWGIHEIVNTNMALAMREATIRRGHDPRDSSIVAFGGAGPVHACRLAKDLDIPRVLIPINAGVNSALGLLTAGARFDLVRTFASTLDDLDVSQINRLYADLSQRADEMLRASDVGANFTLERSADMRYVGQGYEVTVPIPGGEIDHQTVDVFRSAFETVYQERYGFLNRGASIEVVNWRLTALAEAPHLQLERREKDSKVVTTAQKEFRQAYFSELGGFVECPIFDWNQLTEGSIIKGPAIVEARETSAVILPDDQATVDAFGNLLIEIDALAK